MADDGGVDPHDLAGQIDERPARVAGIDGRVGLNERLILGEPADGSFGRRDDARGHRMVEAERAADGQHPLADVKLVGISPFGLNLQIGLDLEDRQVALGVGPHQPCTDIVARTEPDHDLLGVLDDVVIGHDVAFRLVDNHARSQFRALEPRRHAVAAQRQPWKSLAAPPQCEMTAR